MKKFLARIGNKTIHLKIRVMAKHPGDGHYVAIAVTLLLALAIGGIVWAVAGGDSGTVNKWITQIIAKINSFMTKFN